MYLDDRVFQGCTPYDYLGLGCIAPAAVGLGKVHYIYLHERMILAIPKVPPPQGKVGMLRYVSTYPTPYRHDIVLNVLTYLKQAVSFSSN